MKIFNFNEFLLEGKFLNSLYHFTDSYALEMILDSNSLELGIYNGLFKNKLIKFISLTRFKNLKDPMRDSPIRIELDLFKLKYNYKIIPYDFFIHAKQEDKPKSDIRRVKKFEYEEIVLKKIVSLNRYLVSITFDDYRDYLERRNQIKDYINKFNLKNINIFYKNIKLL